MHPGIVYRAYAAGSGSLIMRSHLFLHGVAKLVIERKPLTGYNGDRVNTIQITVTDSDGRIDTTMMLFAPDGGEITFEEVKP